MIAIPYHRKKALSWTVAAIGVAAAAWFFGSYRPVSDRLDAEAAALSAREARVRAARTAGVEVGPAGLDSLLQQLRADSAMLATRIPDAAGAERVETQIKDALGEIERRAGVRIISTEPLAQGQEGIFRTGGFRVQAVGRYEDIGFMLAELASLQRLTAARAFRLQAIPDSLVRTAVAVAPAPPSGSGSPLDSAGAALALADAGEAPFTGLATFQLVWFTLLPPGPAADVTAAANPATPNDGSVP